MKTTSIHRTFNLQEISPNFRPLLSQSKQYTMSSLNQTLGEWARDLNDTIYNQPNIEVARKAFYELMDPSLVMKYVNWILQVIWSLANRVVLPESITLSASIVSLCHFLNKHERPHQCPHKHGMCFTNGKTQKRRMALWRYPQDGQ